MLPDGAAGEEAWRAAFTTLMLGFRADPRGP